MKIYTKTGDDGSTGLYGGGRTSKSSPRIRVIGEVDELNAALGLAAVAIEDPHLRKELNEIQSRLFDLGAELASPTRSAPAMVQEDDIARLEASIDLMTGELPELQAFILPGGSEGGARLHLARTICRSAERALVELDDRHPVREEAKRFLNRLSDWLFTAARRCNAVEGKPETEWRARQPVPANP